MDFELDEKEKAMILSRRMRLAWAKQHELLFAISIVSLVVGLIVGIILGFLLSDTIEAMSTVQRIAYFTFPFVLIVWPIVMWYGVLISLDAKATKEVKRQT